MPSEQFSRQALELFIRQQQAKYLGRSRAAIRADLDQGRAMLKDFAEQGYTVEGLLGYMEEMGALIQLDTSPSRSVGPG